MGCSARRGESMARSHTPTLRVLVDDRWLGPTGIGRYTEEVLRRAPAAIEITRLGRSWPIKDPLTPLRLHRAIREHRPDVFWSPGFMPPHAPATPYVFTIHDLIHLRFGNALHRVYYDHVIKPLARKAQRVLTVSEYCRQELLQWTGLPQSGVIAIPHGVSAAFSPQGNRFSPGWPYLLYVGNRRPYKNVPLLIRAYAAAGLAPEVGLALSGPPDEALSALAAKLGIRERVAFLGPLSEADLAAAYRGALAFVFISSYEGFGLPSIEAMACGTPVLASDTTAFPEVVGDAGLLVSPDEVDQISAAMRRLVADSELRTLLRERGLARAAGYSWDRTAAATWAVIGAAAGKL